MQFLHSLFVCALLTFLISDICKCTNKTNDEVNNVWENNCKVWALQIKKIVDELPTNAINSCQNAQKLRMLEETAQQLATQITARHHTNLLKPLIAHHAMKIVHFCQNLTMDFDDQQQPAAVPDELISQRFIDRIRLINSRADQLHGMVNTTFVDFRTVWQLIETIGDPQLRRSSIIVDNMIGQLVDKVSKMEQQVMTKDQNQNAFPTYYYNTTLFQEARLQLLDLLENDEENLMSDEKRMYKLLQIIPNLWAKATQQMMQNLANYFFDSTFGGGFYGFTIFAEFGHQMREAKRMIYDGFLNESTLDETEKQTIRTSYDHFIKKTVQMYETHKFGRIMQMETIGIVLKRAIGKLMKAESWNKFLNGDQNGKIDSRVLIANLTEVQNLLSKTYNELDMVDLMESCAVVKQQLGKIKHLINDVQLAYKPNDQLALYAEILDCLNIDKLVKSITDESDKMIEKKFY